MNKPVAVARYHLANPVRYLAVPWGIVAFLFALCSVAFGLIIPSGSGRVIIGGPTPGSDLERSCLLGMFVFFFELGVQSISMGLPFGLMLGASRRSFYSGTALLGASLALADSLVLTGLQVIERATGGWGMAMSFFRSSYLLSGPWYATWLTSFVGLAVLFVCGMWFGIVHRRWGAAGVGGFIAVLALVALAVYGAVALGYSWSAVKGHLASLTALDLTGIVAVLTAVPLAGGYATIRRVAV